MYPTDSRVATLESEVRELCKRIKALEAVVKKRKSDTSPYDLSDYRHPAWIPRP